MKLRTKFALVLAVVMLVLSGVVLGSIQLFKENTVQQEREDIAESANLTAAQIDRTLNAKLGSVTSFPIRNNMAEADNTRELLSRFLKSTDFAQVQIVAANGTVVGFDGRGLEPDQREAVVGSNVSGQHYFESSIRGNRSIELLGPGQVAQYDDAVILFSVPIGIDADDERAEGVFAATLFVDDEDGETSPLAFAFPSIRPQERDTQTVALVGENVDGERVVVDGQGRSFESAINATATLDLVRWDVTVTRDRTVLNARLQWLQLVQVVGLLFVLGTVLGMGYWEYSTNLTQTERLLAGFRSLQRGEFDHTMSLTGAEEWTRISDGFNDMTAGLREREQAIREREQRLGVLNRVLRHNLQNDMSVILNYAEMLPELGGDTQEDAIDTILSKGTGLVEHGKKARRIEEAMESAEDGLVEHDLADLVADTLADLREEYPDATVENDLDDSVPVAGIKSLHDAVESVCENALEHNDGEDPLLRVTADRESDRIHLHVTDNGPGIPEYEQQVLSDRDETDLEHGSGLGLFLATWVTEKSDGEIDFENHEDRGATVTLSLPTSAVLSEGDATASGPAPDPDGATNSGAV